MVCSDRSAGPFRMCPTSNGVRQRRLATLVRYLQRRAPFDQELGGGVSRAPDGDVKRGVAPRARAVGARSHVEAEVEHDAYRVGIARARHVGEKSRVFGLEGRYDSRVARRQCGGGRRITPSARGKHPVASFELGGESSTAEKLEHIRPPRSSCHGDR